MRESGRRSSSPSANAAEETVLARRSWRARVATSLLLQELELFAGQAPSDAAPLVAPRWRRLVRRVAGRLGLVLRVADGSWPTGAWSAASPDPASTLPRRPMGDRAEATLNIGSIQRAATEAQMRDLDALLAHLEVDARELEITLRVVRRMRALVGGSWRLGGSR